MNVKLNNIYCEDCRNTIERFEDSSIDLVVTSPPYFNVKEYVNYSSYEEYIETLATVFKGLFSKLKEGRLICVNISAILIPRKSRADKSRRIPLPMHFTVLMEEIGYEFLEDIIWEKPEGSASNRNGGFFRTRNPVTYKPNLVTEYILVFQKPANFLIDKIIRNTPEDIKTKSKVEGEYQRSNIWKINPVTKSFHLAPFPTELAENLVSYYSFVEEVVYDPFMGSGTTALACKKLGRRFVGSEIHKDYVDKSIARLEKSI